MIREDLEMLKELEWEVWKVKKEVKDEDIKYMMEKLRSELIDMIERCEEELKKRVVSKERGVKIDKRGLKVIRRNLGKES